MNYQLTDLEYSSIYDRLTEEELIENDIPREEWVKIDDKIVDGILPIYWVSNYGNVYSEGTGTYLYQGTGKNSEYLMVWFATIYKKSTAILVNRLVKLCFDYNENYKDLEVHHKDNNPKHNWLWNLEWVTPIDHFYMTDYPDINGDNNPQSKLTNDQVRYICELFQSGLRIPEVVKIMENLINVDCNLYNVIYSINKRTKWKSISKNYDF